MAEDRVKFHWATHIEGEAFREFRVDRLSAAGVDVDQPTSTPIWLLL